MYHRVHTGGVCTCRVHHNFVRNGKYCERGWACTPHPCTPESGNHRVHRVATAAFWRTFSHEGKIGPGWWGWGVHAHPPSLHLPSPVKLQCTLQLSGHTNPVSSLGKYVLCGGNCHSVCTLWKRAPNAYLWWLARRVVFLSDKMMNWWYPLGPVETTG
jgi:hypothetical protein